MFAVRIQGGLGNQIFQYLFALELKKQHPDVKVCIDLNSYNRFDPHNGYELKKWIVMNPEIGTLTGWEHFRLTGQLPYVGSRKLMASAASGAKLLRKFTGAVNRCIAFANRFLPKKPGVICQEYTHGYPQVVPENLDPASDLYFDGTWFSQTVSPAVLREGLCFRPQEDSEFLRLARQLAGETSVGIHIRHGDYPAWGYEVLSEEYYRNAITYMLEQLDEPRFYIFSDDPEFARTVVAPMCEGRAVVMDRNNAKNACLDLQLMTYCRHHIIANSTFSYVAWLLSDRQGLLIAPKTWINGNTTWDIPHCHYLEQ